MKMEDLPASYVNKLCDSHFDDQPRRIKKSLVKRKPPPPSRPKSAIEAEDVEILKLLKVGKKNKEIYNTLIALGKFRNVNGDVMNFRTASTRCTRLRDSLINNKPF